MNVILKLFLKLKIFSLPYCYNVLEHYTQFSEEVKRVNSHELRQFKTWETKLDDFTSKSMIQILKTIQQVPICA